MSHSLRRFLAAGAAAADAGDMKAIASKNRRHQPKHRKPRAPRRNVIRSWRTWTLAMCGVGVALSGVIGGLGVAHAARPRPHQYSCDRGTFCFWNAEGYSGRSQFLDLRDTNPGDCTPLREGLMARSLANRSDRDLVVYHDQHCSRTAEHLTYPGGGTFVPEAPFPVAAVRIEGKTRGVRPASAREPHSSGSRFPTGDTRCGADRFCYWPEPEFPGKPRILDLATEPTNVCIPLAKSDEARSFVNRTDREITLYQDGHCGTNGAFRTYPGGGTYVPRAPYVVRAIEVWNRGGT